MSRPPRRLRPHLPPAWPPCLRPTSLRPARPSSSCPHSRCVHCPSTGPARTSNPSPTTPSSPPLPFCLCLQVQYDPLPSPSAPPPPPPVINSSFLPPLTGDHRQQGQQLVLEWQVQRAREQIAMQEAAAEQRRQEQAMRVKMEALKAVLGIHPSNTTAPTQHHDTPRVGNPPALHVACPWQALD